MKSKRQPVKTMKPFLSLFSDAVLIFYEYIHLKETIGAKPCTFLYFRVSSDEKKIKELYLK